MCSVWASNKPSNSWIWPSWIPFLSVTCNSAELELEFMKSGKNWSSSLTQTCFWETCPTVHPHHHDPDLHLDSYLWWLVMNPPTYSVPEPSPPWDLWTPGLWKALTCPAPRPPPSNTHPHTDSFHTLFSLSFLIIFNFVFVYRWLMTASLFCLKILPVSFRLLQHVCDNNFCIDRLT